jgi:alkyl hydroperoxide reductase subunit D
MSIETLKNQIPDYAKDIKLNLSSLANDETLNVQQLWGTFLASALATRQADLIMALEVEAAQKISPDALNAVKAAAAIMAMNNIYYKFVGMMPEYQTLPAKLRMNILANPGVDKGDFELWSLAVSAVNGCQFCVQSHEKQLRDHGFSSEQVQTAVRVASVVHALASIMDGEAALQAPMARAA